MKRIPLLFALAVAVIRPDVFAQNRPFPQHVAYAAGIKPNNVTQSAMDSTVSSYWSAWSSRYLKSASTGGYYVAYNLEGQGDSGAATVSEAHGYGMVLCAYFADKTHFDGMFTYYRNHPSHNNSYLMAWEQDTSFNDMNGADSATDGDMDIAYALLLADKQWGSSGAINYRQAALNIINAIMQSDVNQSTWTLRLGDWATSGTSKGYAYATATRPSDFMFDHLQSFLSATGDSRWTNVINKTNTVVNSVFSNYSPNTGLMPDFIVYNGSSYLPAPGGFLEASTDGEYAYNSCRTPWRFATDYVLRGSSGILAEIRKMNSWIQSASGGNAASVWPGYTLAGTALTKSYNDSAFTSPFAVSAMTDAGNQTWLNKLWTWIAGRGINAGDGYFGNSITMQCALVVSGNAWSPTTGPSSSNIAPTGTAYGWFGMTSATANTNQTAQPGLNDGNVTADVDLDANGDAVGAWEGAGVKWSTAHTISAADFINGDITSVGDGFLTASLKLQYTTDGSTWTNSSWSLSPSYPYSSAAGGQKYTFSGAAVSGVVGVRFVGQVRTTDTSYHWIVKEVQVTGQ